MDKVSFTIFLIPFISRSQEVMSMKRNLKLPTAIKFFVEKKEMLFTYLREHGSTSTTIINDVLSFHLLQIFQREPEK